MNIDVDLLDERLISEKLQLAYNLRDAIQCNDYQACIISTAQLDFIDDTLVNIIGDLEQ